MLPVAYKDLVETKYNLPIDESNDDALQYLAVYLNMSMVLESGIKALMEKHCEASESYSGMLQTLQDRAYELQIEVLEKVEEYGRITDTNVVDIDDMKVMHFLAQSLAEKCLNNIRTEYLKAITNISYRYMKSQIYDIVNTDFKCLMIDKLDHMYENENISIREIWDLYGRFGIYTLLKSIYLQKFRLITPSIDVAGEI